MYKGKKLLKVVSTLCTASIAATLLCTAPVSAASVRKVGDVDGNGSVSISDVTLIQRYLAGSAKLDSTALNAADVDFDGTVSINDATAIQRYLVGLGTAFTPLTANKWTSLSAGSTKTFKFKSALATSRVSIYSYPSWIKVSLVKNSKGYTGVKLTTTKNSSKNARNSTVKIKVDGNIYSISVKQMPTVSTKGWDACYTYAMQLDSDPRSNTGKAFDYFSNPGTPGRISGKSELNKFTIDQFNIIEDSNYWTDFQNYTLKYVKADLETMGWGIKRAKSATAKVAEGDWLVCLTFNPSEYIVNDDQMIYIKNTSGAPLNAEDYHWYRRSGTEGNYTWSHKRGNTSVLTLATNKTPENYDSKTNPIMLMTNPVAYNTAMSGYVNYYKSLKKLYDQGKYRADPEEYDQSFVCAYQPKSGELGALEYYSQAYMLIGYYEVGPNAF